MRFSPQLAKLVNSFQISLTPRNQFLCTQLSKSGIVDERLIAEKIDSALDSLEFDDASTSLAFLKNMDGSLSQKILLRMWGRGLRSTLGVANVFRLATLFPEDFSALSEKQIRMWREILADIAGSATNSPGSVAVAFKLVATRSISLRISAPNSVAVDAVFEPILAAFRSLVLVSLDAVRDSGDSTPDLVSLRASFAFSAYSTSSTQRDLRTRIVLGMIENGSITASLECVRFLLQNYERWNCCNALKAVFATLSNSCFSSRARPLLRDLKAHELFLAGLAATYITDEKIKQFCCYGVALLLGADEENAAVTVSADVLGIMIGLLKVLTSGNLGNVDPLELVESLAVLCVADSNKSHL